MNLCILGAEGSKGFDFFKSWSNLSPWYSVDRTSFGLDSSPEDPETSRVTGLHFLHRHGARYLTAWCEFFRTCQIVQSTEEMHSFLWRPAKFAGRPHKAPEAWNVTGDLEFLNEWQVSMRGMLTLASFTYCLPTGPTSSGKNV